MKKITFIAHSVLDIIFPNNCEICNCSLTQKEKFICLNCVFDLPFINRHQYQIESLQKLFWGRVDIQSVHSLFNYQKESNTQQILHAIKYKKRTKLGHYMGRMMGKQLDLTSSLDYIIPIPLHPKKEKERGFNQSLVLALGLQEIIDVKIENSVISRVKINKSQTKFSKYDRWDNVNKIFKLNNPKTLENKHILLVDDVLTTGATIESCAIEILNKVNCKISIATLAARI